MESNREGPETNESGAADLETTASRSTPDWTYVGPPRHSGVGIASFVLAMVSLVLFVIGLIISTAAARSITQEFLNSGVPIDQTQVLQKAPTLVAAGLLFFLTALVSFVGGVLGIVGLFQRARRKVFAILGTVFNLAGWVIFAGLFILALVIGRASL